MWWILEKTNLQISHIGLGCVLVTENGSLVMHKSYLKMFVDMWDRDYVKMCPRWCVFGEKV